jgi:integrase
MSRYFVTASGSSRSGKRDRAARVTGSRSSPGTGLRRGDVLGPRWADLDLDGGLVRVCRSMTEVRGRAELIEGKTDSARRDVGIGPVMVARLRRHKAAQAAHRLTAGPSWLGAAEVFTSRTGAPIKPTTASRRFTRAASRADVPTITLHDLRHTHATLLLSDGVPIAAVAARLGHADPSITLGVYAHALPADDARAAEAAERLLYG